MLKKVFWIILLLALIFLGRKETIAFFCETELTKEQVLYERFADTLVAPPDSVLQKSIILSITAHIVRKENGTGGISETVVLEEIERLNEAFGPTGISFEVCTFNYINDKRFYNLTKYDEARLLSYDIENTINIYFVNQISSVSEGKICGYTYYPTKNLDNLFLANSCVPRGTTLIHEFGHFFGLYHTHELQFGAELVSGANCRGAGDLICDTPADPGLKSSLISESCEFTGFVTDIFDTAYEPPVHNYMSYSRQSCRDTFTANQLFKMRVNYHYFKSHIKKLNTTFEVSDSIIVVGDTLTLTATGGTAYWWSTGDTTAQINLVPDTSATYSVNIVTDNGCNVFKKYAVEVISGNFISAPAFICAGEAATVVFNDTKEDLIYILSDQQGGTAYSSIGNGGTLYIETNVSTAPLDNQIYTVSILNPATERTWQLKKPISIKVVPFLEEKKIDLLLPADSVCQGSIATISVPAADPALHYQLMEGNKAIGEAKRGNGDTLTLITAPIDTAVTYHLQIFNECYRTLKRNIISFIPFQPPATDSLRFSLSSREVIKGNSMLIRVENSKPSLSYQLMLNNTFVGEAVRGNGKDLVFDTPPIMEKTSCCIVVYNNQTDCRTTTSYPLTVSVEPPKPAIDYVLSPGNLLEYTLPVNKYSRLKLYHLDGRLASTIVDKDQESGDYQYQLDAVSLNITPGLYMLRWKVEGELIFQKIIPVR